ncbi:MAG: phosphoribosylamine--glycine ligase [Candidatus Omnitrophica bacterium]|nr:phosphoribosylamine--glycine ligase [Candidatus Omnitrophota bacterium]
MNILVIGSGGREHALVWKIAQSPRVKKIFCAPGNGGIADIAECVDIKADDVPALLKFAQTNHIDLTVVGPEVPLVLGLVDVFAQAGLKAFGPAKAAARLEGSKAFAKEFMIRHNIPTAAYGSFDDIAQATAFLDKFRVPSDARCSAGKGDTASMDGWRQFPLVVKADGLAAGKGVVICQTKAEALDALKSIMADRVFKDAGKRVVIEEFLKGEEASILAVADGNNFIILESSQDHKRIFDNDQGPNTGGMGAYSPAPVVTPALMKQISETVIKPSIEGMRKDGTPFKGILYAGIMVTAQGPKVLEFNTRFGDPETQAVLPRLKSDIVEMMLASVEGRLDGLQLEWDPRSCVCVVLAAGGYPGDYVGGKIIRGLKDVAPGNGVVFHAGTKKQGDQILTAGGRVLGVVALGAGIAQAIEQAYKVVSALSFEGMQYRRDIGRKALER